MTSPPDDILDLLTAYALDALDPDEVARVSALLAAQPELRTTLAELRATADLLPYGLPEATPPADLRQRVLDRATGRAGTATPSAPATSRARRWILALGSLASLAVLAAAIGWAQLFSTRAQVGALQQELNAMQAQVAEAQKVLASLDGSGSGAILQTRDGKTVFVAQLQALPPGRVYQLWRIQNNSPTSAGIFLADQHGFVSADLSSDQQPQAGEILAVTNEPDGGSLGPTSDPLITGPANA